jgi:hypothetical protein
MLSDPAPLEADFLNRLDRDVPGWMRQPARSLQSRADEDQTVTHNNDSNNGFLGPREQRREGLQAETDR